MSARRILSWALASLAITFPLQGSASVHRNSAIHYFLHLHIITGCRNEVDKPTERWVSDDVCNEYAMVERLRVALGGSDMVARVYYRAACQPANELAVPFPKLKLRMSGTTRGLDAVMEIFRDEESVAVTADSSGIIRIRIGDVPDNGLLMTKITSLTFTADDQYNPEDALSTIENSPEITGAQHKLGLEFAPALIDHLVQPPDDAQPHLPHSLQDVTMDSALDAVAATFRGVVVYGVDSCEPQRVYTNIADLDVSPDEVDEAEHEQEWQAAHPVIARTALLSVGLYNPSSGKVARCYRAISAEPGPEQTPAMKACVASYKARGYVEGEPHRTRR